MKSNFLKIAGVNSEKEFYAKYPTEEAFFQAHPEAMQMKQGGEMIRRADGHYSQRGLWDNIRANKGSGKKPTKEMLEQERKIRQEEMKHGGAVDLNAFYNQPRYIQTNIYQNGGAHYDDSRDAWVAADGTIGPNGPYEFALGGMSLPEFQWAGQSNTPAATPSVVMLPDQQKIWHQNQNMWGTPPSQTIKVPDNEAGNTNFTGTPTGSGTSFTPTPPGQQTTIKLGDNEAGNTNLTGAAPTSGQSFTPGFKVADNEAGQTNFTGGSPTGGKEFIPSGPVNPKLKYNWMTSEDFKSTMNTPAAETTPAATNAANTNGTTNQPGNTSMWQQVADHQVFNGKTYRKLNDLATMPLYNPAVGMLSDNGLAGFIKMGIGAAAGISGMATGLDNIWRGFKGRKIENTQTGTSPGWQMGKAADPNANMQESVQQEMMRKQQNQVNPPGPAKPVVPIPGMDKLDEMNRTAAYGGTMYKAADGVDLSKKPEFDPTKVKVGQTQYVADLQGGLNRTLGANMGISMFNNTLGYKQAMKSVRENSVKAGMTDFGYQPDDTNWMPMGYDTLNTGPGQTQAPNLYTPVQYAGMQMASQYEEGGEYDLTEEEIQQILAAGGEVEFM